MEQFSACGIRFYERSEVVTSQWIFACFTLTFIVAGVFALAFGGGGLVGYLRKREWGLAALCSTLLLLVPLSAAFAVACGRTWSCLVGA